MLYILRNFTRIQNELAQAKARIRELSDDELAWQNCQLRNRLEKGQGKYDRLKRAYNQLLVANKKKGNHGTSLGFDSGGHQAEV